MQTAAEHQQRGEKHIQFSLCLVREDFIHFSSLCIMNSLTSIFKNKYDCYKEQSSGDSSCERLRVNYFLYRIFQQRGLEEIAVFTKLWTSFILPPTVMRPLGTFCLQCDTISSHYFCNTQPLIHINTAIAILPIVMLSPEDSNEIIRKL